MEMALKEPFFYNWNGVETPGTAAVNEAVSDLSGLFDLDGRLRAVADGEAPDSPYEMIVTPEKERALLAFAADIRRLHDRLNRLIRG